MSEKLSKILGTVFFVLIVSSIIYLVFFIPKNKNKGEIKMISLEGNHLLSEAEYLSFVKLNSVSLFGELTLPVIKDRFEKHPYVAKAEVRYLSNSEIEVKLIEKKITALILNGNDPYFISDQFQVLPIFPNTKFVDAPVISNSNTQNFIPLTVVNAEDIKQAFKIIDAARLTNIKVLRQLSEVNLRKGGDAVLTFVGIKPPVIFGKGDEARKMVYLGALLEGILEGPNLIGNSEYIDVRFMNEIFIRTAETGMNG